ncbi:hypothetical protein NUU61_005519 [Penicillium alfredii]|uniref:Uncharacterized protein n=1 Tax=Penicillium alfredii TaxID=1506179 RepID=A0A9W9K7Q4_9EURO|nr:uncharacterized protein NUU61_005519 [Penicillium alfredii]KAJ5096163.1 hypothetical protein NUU61_005519 [Penicillium alfredii]
MRLDSVTVLAALLALTGLDLVAAQDADQVERPRFTLPREIKRAIQRGNSDPVPNPNPSASSQGTQPDKPEGYNVVVVTYSVDPANTKITHTISGTTHVPGKPGDAVTQTTQAIPSNAESKSKNNPVATSQGNGAPNTPRPETTSSVPTFRKDSQTSQDSTENKWGFDQSSNTQTSKRTTPANPQESGPKGGNPLNLVPDVANSVVNGAVNGASSAWRGATSAFRDAVSATNSPKDNDLTNFKNNDPSRLLKPNGSPSESNGSSKSNAPNLISKSSTSAQPRGSPSYDGGIPELLSRVDNGLSTAGEDVRSALDRFSPETATSSSSASSSSQPTSQGKSPSNKDSSSSSSSSSEGFLDKLGVNHVTDALHNITHPSGLSQLPISVPPIAKATATQSFDPLAPVESIAKGLNPLSGLNGIPSGSMTIPGFSGIPSGSMTIPGFSGIPSGGLSIPGFSGIPSGGLSIPGLNGSPSGSLTPPAVPTASIPGGIFQTSASSNGTGATGTGATGAPIPSGTSKYAGGIPVPHSPGLQSTSGTQAGSGAASAPPMSAPTLSVPGSGAQDTKASTAPHPTSIAPPPPVTTSKPVEPQPKPSEKSSSSDSSDFMPSSVLLQSSSTSGSSSSETGEPSHTSLPDSILPPASQIKQPPENSSLLQLGFNGQLPWPFVATTPLSSSQIFDYVPTALKHAFPDVKDVAMYALEPYLSWKKTGYNATLAIFYWPGNEIDSLAEKKRNPNSALYKGNRQAIDQLMSLIDPSIPLMFEGNNPSSDGNSDGNDDGNGNGDNHNSNTDDGSGNSSKIKASSVGTGVGVVAGAAAYGAGMFWVARRYRKRRQLHQRSSSTVDQMSEGSHAGSVFGAGGRSLGSQNSRGTNRSQMISAPVMAENSLGWN